MILHTVEARNAQREREAARYFLHTFLITIATIVLYGLAAAAH